MNLLYLLKAKSLKFSIDILNHKNIFLLYYINLNAILNHKNKLLLFFLRKKSSNTIFYFHMLFIYLFLSLPFCLFLLWNSLVSLPLHLIISTYESSPLPGKKKKKKLNDHLKPPTPQSITTANPQPTNTTTSKTHKQGLQIHPKTKTNPPLTITTLKTHSKTKQNQQSATKKPMIHNLSHNQNKPTIYRIGFISTTLNFNSKPTLIIHKPLHHTWFAKRENKAFYKRERERVE